MTEDFAIILGILVLGYVFVTPFVLTILFYKQRRRILDLESDVEALYKRQDWVDNRLAEKAAAEPEIDQPEFKPVEPPIQQQAPVVESRPAEPLEVPAPKKVPVSVEPISIAREEPVAESREESKDIWWLAVHVREFLKGLGMWPPSSESGHDRETILMQWWLPRVGGLLALLSALFFAVYINQNTSPVFKCLEMLAVSIAITGLGYYLERRYLTFGGVVFVTGLIMLYLTSVSAYVLPATRVIENPLVGSLVQAVALILICAVGLLRRSGGIVLLAFHFGYFLGIFMAFEGMREGALIAAGLLFFAGVILSRQTVFRHLVFVVIPGSFLVLLAFPALAVFRIVEIPGNLSSQIFINLIFASIAILYLYGGIGKDRQSRILLSIASSLAILSVLWFFRTFYPDGLEWAALVLGINMLVLSIAGWTTRGCGFLAQILFIKATFLIGVWAILHYAGDLRWMVLALQTVVVAIAARRARVVALELAVWAVAIVSLIYYLSSLDSVPQSGSFVWWMMVLYPGVITLAFAFLLQLRDTPGFSFRDASRKWAYGLVPLVALFLWRILFMESPTREFEMALPFVCILYVGTALAWIPIFSCWMLLMISALSFALANVYFCDEPFSIFILISLIIAAVGAVFSLVRKSGWWSEISENAVYVLILTSFSLWMLQVLNDWKGQAILVFLLGVGVVLGGLIPKVRHFGSWAFLPLLVFMMTESAAVGAGVLSLFAFACGILWLAIPVLVPGIKSGQGWADQASIWSGIGAFMFWLYAILFGDQEATWLSGQLVLGVIALIFLLGAFRWSVHGYLFGALLFVTTVAARHSLSMMGGSPYAPWKSEALISAGLIYAFSLLLFFLRPIPSHLKNPESVEKFQQVSSGLAAILFFLTSVVTFRYEGLAWMDWYTPILAVTAFVMILLGLFCSDLAFRRLGLIALVVPLLRLFLVDVQDVLHRIIAFAAAAILLTFLGYMYHRLASRLGRTDE